MVRKEKLNYDSTPLKNAAHQPVMLAEVVDLFSRIETGVIVDATLGAGGHSFALLDSAKTSGRRGLKVLGIDRDATALAIAEGIVSQFKDRYQLVLGSFVELDEIVASFGLNGQIGGVLMDLGVSSMQLDNPLRGFSYRNDGPLDMRMDTSKDASAYEIINTYSAERLEEIIRTYGDEKYSRRIANAIVSARPVGSTVELAEIVKNAIPAATRRHGGHPATRTFQAIRMEVNSEIYSLEKGLKAAIGIINSGGIIAALTYHSGEDQLVKRVFDQACFGGCTCPVDLPCVCGAVKNFEHVTPRRGLRPSLEEVNRNHRSASCRLRAIRKKETSDGNDSV